MPGPDDIMRWIEKHIAEKGLPISLTELSTEELQALRSEAEAACHALRAIDTLLGTYQAQLGEAGEAERV